MGGATPTPITGPATASMTDDGKPILHVVFGMSAAASLRQALHQVDRHDRVIGLSDDLSCGPINPVTAELRHHWLQEGMGYEDRSADVFWTEATRLDVFPVA